jgi:hypothetical protein
LKFIVCSPDPKMCICTDNVCSQEVFQISFPQFVREAKYEKSVYSWQKKNVALNIVSLKNILHFLLIQFSEHDIPIHASLVLYILWYRI